MCSYPKQNDIKGNYLFIKCIWHLLLHLEVYPWYLPFVHHNHQRSFYVYQPFLRSLPLKIYWNNTNTLEGKIKHLWGIYLGIKWRKTVADEKQWELLLEASQAYAVVIDTSVIVQRLTQCSDNPFFCRKYHLKNHQSEI